MNQFGGAGVGKELGLWDKNDGNNPLKFMSLEEYQSIGKYGIIPYPTSLKERKEGTLALNTLTAITYVPSETQDIQNTVSSFAEQLKKTSGIELALKESTGTSEAKAINLIQDESVEKEAYTLQVEDDRITLKASTGAGFFYGLQTLKQMMPREIYAQTKAENTVWEVPFLSIEDKPNVGYRGFMLDIARHFFSKEEVKRIIDESYDKAKSMIAEYRDVLDRCAALLLEKEKITRDEFEALFDEDSKTAVGHNI